MVVNQNGKDGDARITTPNQTHQMAQSRGTPSHSTQINSLTQTSIRMELSMARTQRKVSYQDQDFLDMVAFWGWWKSLGDDLQNAFCLMSNSESLFVLMQTEEEKLAVFVKGYEKDLVYLIANAIISQSEYGKMLRGSMFAAFDSIVYKLRDVNDGDDDDE